jgi:hypothetical protein
VGCCASSAPAHDQIDLDQGILGETAVANSTEA